MSEMQKAMMVPGVEVIRQGEKSLVYLIRTDELPTTSEFLTPPDFKQQVGFIVYGAGKEVPRHLHRELERHLLGTSEVLLVLRGRCLMDVFDNEKVLVATKELRQGDLVLLVDGGHGFRMVEDTVFLEVKQGPYTGLDEKERF